MQREKMTNFQQKIQIENNLEYIRSKLFTRNGIYIHPTAEVSDRALIGVGTRIWNNAQIREDVIIGNNVIISKDVYIDIGVKIGHRVKIQNGVSVYRGVEIDDDVFLGPHMTFTNDLYPRAFIGEFTLYKTKICHGASIGAHATIICGHNIGCYAMIGAGSVVTKDIPDFALAYGNPAIIQGWVSRSGGKLHFDDDGIAECPITKEKYQILSQDKIILLEA